MEKFLVNMAVVKVNWDQSQQDILDNYIPLVSYTLYQHPSDIVSLEEFKEKFRELAEFDIPTGAIISLLKRASKKHGLLQKQQHGQYEIDRKRLKSNTYAETRDSERRKYNQLKRAFRSFCTDQLNSSIEESEVDQYFFETLYDIAPALFARVSDIEHLDPAALSNKQYLVSRFITYAVDSDPTSFEAILSFVRGAMLTETFYYSHPSDIRKKMRSVKVFFDTQFLLRALGLCDKRLAEPCRELVSMLQAMGVKMRAFRHTYDEMHGILHAAATQLQKQGRLLTRRPGDVFDYFNRTNSTSSDVELAIATLEINLRRLGISIEEKPGHTKEYGINEVALGEALEIEFQTQNQAARNHDIDCLAAVHRLRLGKKMEYLESCNAIFITTNAALARVSSSFFGTEYEHSNVPVCMGDQVFTTLIWLKAVKKIPNLPKEQLVASCYAATTPSEALWTKYVKEADKLKAQGNVGEGDYAVLVHSLEARDKLMELTLGEDEILHGTVEEVLAAAKAKYTEGLANELATEKRKVRATTEKVRSVGESIEGLVEKVVLYGSLSIWTIVLGFGLFVSAPEAWTREELLSVNSAAFLALCFVTLLNLLFGVKMVDHCKIFAAKCGSKARNKVESYLSPT